MLVEDCCTDRSHAVLHDQIVPKVGQCVSRGVVVEARHNRADAAALRSGLGTNLIESNCPNGYTVPSFRIRFIQFLDMKALEVDRLLLNGGRCGSAESDWFAAPGDDDDRDNRNNCNANGGETERSSFRKKERQRDQDQNHYPQHGLYFHRRPVVRILIMLNLTMYCRWRCNFNAMGWRVLRWQP